MILLLDARDSFVHTLAGYLEELGEEVQVVRAHEIDVPGIQARAPTHLVLSPGPCTPQEAGVFLPAVRAFHGVIPIFGVCLGHQAIWTALGGRLRPACPPLHGRATPVLHRGHPLFRGIPTGFAGGRYHSLALDEAPRARGLGVIARSPGGEVLAVASDSGATLGVQFHPESILTEHGHRLLENALELGRRSGAGEEPGLAAGPADLPPDPRTPVPVP